MNGSYELKIKLQRKLNLARVVEREARRANFAEVLQVCKVRRAADGDDAIAAESRCVECRVVQDVEEFAPEFHSVALTQLDILEYREIESADSGSGNLAVRSP